MSYIPRLFEFLRQLGQNNDRAWFQAHKAEYDDLRQAWLADLDRVIGAMTPWEPGMASQSGRTAVYRIYRDTRFSADKSPYKTYFSAAFSPYGRKSDRAGYYLELSPFESHRSGLYGGLWCMERPVLNKLRRAIVDNIEEWEAILNDSALKEAFPHWCSSMLKTIPKGWDRDHPQAFYLRMTNYGLFSPLSEDYFLSAEWPEETARRFHALKPFCDFLNYSIDEEV